MYDYARFSQEEFEIIFSLVLHKNASDIANNAKRQITWAFRAYSRNAGTFTGVKGITMEAVKHGSYVYLWLQAHPVLYQQRAI